MLCTHRVMECVAASGQYEVHALCMRFRGEQEYEYVNGVHVHRFRPSFWTRLRNENGGRQERARLDRLMELIQKFLTIPVFPLLRPLTASRLLRRAVKLHKREGFGIVVSEHHELDTLLAGCRLKRRFDGLKHIAVLWDPVQGQIATVHLPGRFTARRIARVESFSSRYSTLLISMESIRDYFRDNGDISADHRRFLGIPGIIKPEPEVPTEHMDLLREGFINIVFSGWLSVSQRNPLPIIDLLDQCDNAEKINIVFFSMGADDGLREAAKSFRGTIVCHDYIPLKELHTIYRHADYLLNVSHINANMVPSKIFEYMSYGKPVISTYVTDGDSAQKFLSRYSEGLCIDLKAQAETNVASLNSFLSAAHRSVPFDEVQRLFAENSPEAYLSVINEMAS